MLAEPRLELLAPVNLNIVCFRYRAGRCRQVNGEIVVDIQESGIAAPSTTVLDGQLAIRAAIVNHRTDVADIDGLVAAVLEFGARRSSAASGRTGNRDADRGLIGKRLRRSSGPSADRSGGAALGASVCAARLDRLVLIQQLLFVGDQLLGFLQRLIEIAAEDVVVDALDDRPGARHGATMSRTRLK